MDKEKPTQVPDCDLKPGRPVQKGGGFFRIRLNWLDRIKVLLGFHIVVNYTHSFGERTIILETNYSVNVRRKRAKD